MPRKFTAISSFLALCFVLAVTAHREPSFETDQSILPPALVEAERSPVPVTPALPIAPVPQGIEESKSPMGEGSVRGRLDRLAVGSTLTLPDPEGGELALAVEAVRRTGGFTFIELTSQGLSSQVTLRGKQHMATIATPRGSYHVRDLDDASTWIPQRVLDQRANPHAKDYRHAPVG